MISKAAVEYMYTITALIVVTGQVIGYTLSGHFFLSKLLDLLDPVITAILFFLFYLCKLCSY